MSERAYLFSRLSKGLSNALAGIAEGAEMANPHIATRVYAHDRGKAASKLISMNRAQETKVNARYRKPLKARHPVTAPISIARDELGRAYDMQGVRRGQAAAERVIAQGRWGRKMSREQLAV